MFHNSTTLHRLSTQNAYTSGENRRVFFLEGLKSGLASGVESLKVAGTFAGRWAKRLSWTFGGPLLWRGAKVGYKGAEWAGEQVETAGRIGLEAAAGVKDMTLVPFVTWVRSAITDVKMNLWDVPKHALKTAWEAGKGPFRFIKGTRDMIWGTLKNSALAVKNTFLLRGHELVENTRGFVESLFAPITQPLVPVLAAAGGVASTVAMSKLQYLTSVRDSALQARDGFNRVLNAPQVGHVKAHEAFAERAITKKKKEEEEAELAEAEGKAGKSTAGGKVKGEGKGKGKEAKH